jgi:hypothetical protein
MSDRGRTVVTVLVLAVVLAAAIFTPSDFHDFLIRAWNELKP